MPRHAYVYSRLLVYAHSCMLTLAHSLFMELDTVGLVISSSEEPLYPIDLTDPGSARYRKLIRSHVRASHIIIFTRPPRRGCCARSEPDPDFQHFQLSAASASSDHCRCLLRILHGRRC